MRGVYLIMLALVVGLGATSCGPREEAPAGEADTVAPVAPPVTDTVPPAAQDTPGQRPDTAVRDTAR